MTASKDGAREIDKGDPAQIEVTGISGSAGVVSRRQSGRIVLLKWCGGWPAVLWRGPPGLIPSTVQVVGNWVSGCCRSFEDGGALVAHWFLLVTDSCGCSRIHGA